MWITQRAPQNGLTRAWRPAILLALLIALALSLAGCGGDDVAALPESGGVPPHVLLLGQDKGDGFVGVQAYLAPFGFPTLDTFDNQLGTPTLAQLLAYDAVMVWADSTPASQVGLGDVLADYVDAGGGVVMTTPTFIPAYGPTGRFVAQGYMPFNQDGVAALGTAVSVGTVYSPLHPVLLGVGSVTTSLRDDPSFGSGARIADWSDGYPMLGVSYTGRVAAITLYPIGAAAMGGNYPRLFANALTYVSAQ